MAINVGDKLPDATFTVMGPDGPGPQTTQDVFGGKKAVLFAVPGAFTPTCSKQHLPGFVANADKIKGKGIDTIACTSVRRDVGSLMASLECFRGQGQAWARGDPASRSAPALDLGAGDPPDSVPARPPRPRTAG